MHFFFFWVNILHALKYIENSFSILIGRKELGTTSELDDNCHVALSVFQNSEMYMSLEQN